MLRLCGCPGLPKPDGGREGNRSRVISVSADHRQGHFVERLFRRAALAEKTPLLGRLRSGSLPGQPHPAEPRRLRPLPVPAPGSRSQRSRVAFPGRVNKPSAHTEPCTPVFINKAIIVHKFSHLLKETQTTKGVFQAGRCY